MDDIETDLMKSRVIYKKVVKERRLSNGKYLQKIIQETRGHIFFYPWLDIVKSLPHNFRKW